MHQRPFAPYGQLAARAVAPASSPLLSEHVTRIIACFDPVPLTKSATHPTWTSLSSGRSQTSPTLLGVPMIGIGDDIFLALGAACSPTSARARRRHPGADERLCRSTRAATPPTASPPRRTPDDIKATRSRARCDAMTPFAKRDSSARAWFQNLPAEVLEVSPSTPPSPASPRAAPGGPRTRCRQRTTGVAPTPPLRRGAQAAGETLLLHADSDDDEPTHSSKHQPPPQRLHRHEYAAQGGRAALGAPYARRSGAEDESRRLSVVVGAWAGTPRQPPLQPPPRAGAGARPLAAQSLDQPAALVGVAGLHLWRVGGAEASP